MKVLITGVCGYIGSVLARDLLSAGHAVKGVDNLSLGNGGILSLYGIPGFNFIKADICDSSWMKSALEDVDAIVHLAAIVGDPACAKNPELAEAVNWLGAKNLFEAANKSSSVSRFIFSSTCSNYGKSASDELLDENAALNPVSLYAKLKVQFEQFLAAQPTKDGLSVTSLRFSTAYGLSPRMRFDLTVNEFARDAFHKKELKVFGEQFWRPYCNTADLAKACMKVLEASPEKVARQVFNVGANGENYTKKMIVELLQTRIPDLKVEYVHKTEDPRDYKVSFKKISSVLDFQPSKSVPFGLTEIVEGLRLGVFGDPYSKAYSNI